MLKNNDKQTCLLISETDVLNSQKKTTSKKDHNRVRILHYKEMGSKRQNQNKKTHTHAEET
jgi:hypothetical protein